MKNLFIGVDFSKEKVDVAILFADGLVETAARVFNEFKTTVSGYRQLVKWVEQNSCGIDSSLWALIKNSYNSDKLKEIGRLCYIQNI
jgi:transposase